MGLQPAVAQRVAGVHLCFLQPALQLCELGVARSGGTRGGIGGGIGGGSASHREQVFLHFFFFAFE